MRKIETLAIRSGYDVEKCAFHTSNNFGFPRGKLVLKV